MPMVVVAGGIIQCSHQGKVQLAGGASQLTISGAKALTSGMEVGITFGPPGTGVIAPCPIVYPSSGNPSPCSVAVKASVGVSALLTIASVGVLLDNATGPAVNPNSPGSTWSIAQAGQSLLSVEN
jgi:hypothetical protein